MAQEKPSVPAAQAPQTTTGGNADGTYTLRTGTRLIVVDAVVTDKHGNLVLNLTRDAFHITDAGESQQIRSFEAAGEDTISPAVTISSTADLDRLAPKAAVNIIVLDEFNNLMQDVAFAQYSLKEYLKRQPDKLPSPTMLVSVDLTHFTVLRDYTQSKQELLEALHRSENVTPLQRFAVEWAPARYTAAFRTLMRVAEATEGHLGHKNMIWVGRGFPSLPLDKMTLDSHEKIATLAQDTVNLLRDARVTLYTIDPAGISVYGPPGGRSTGIDDLFGGNYQFAKLAKGTGGSALYGRNDVDAEIGTSIRDGSSFYSMSYRPSDSAEGSQKFRRIKLTVDGPGMVVTTREGYYLESASPKEDMMNPSKRLQSDLLAAESSTMVYDGVPLTVAANGTEPDSYMIHVDSSAVTWSDATEADPRRSEIVFMVCWFDAKNKELKRDARTLKFHAPPEVPATGSLDRPLIFPYKIDRQPGAVRARVIVRVTSSGKIGAANVSLQ